MKYYTLMNLEDAINDLTVALDSEYHGMDRDTTTITILEDVRKTLALLKDSEHKKQRLKKERGNYVA